MLNVGPWEMGVPHPAVAESMTITEHLLIFKMRTSSELHFSVLKIFMWVQQQSTQIQNLFTKINVGRYCIFYCLGFFLFSKDSPSRKIGFISQLYMLFGNSLLVRASLSAFINGFLRSS